MVAKIKGNNNPLLDKLIEQGLITTQQYQEILAKQESSNIPIEKIILEDKLVEPEEFARVKGQVLNVHLH